MPVCIVVLCIYRLRKGLNNVNGKIFQLRCLFLNLPVKIVLESYKFKKIAYSEL